MADNSYSGPIETYDGVPVRSLRFYQLGEQDQAKVGQLKLMVDDVKTIITKLAELQNQVDAIDVTPTSTSTNAYYPNGWL